MDDKIKLEDMVLGQIKEQKRILSEKVRLAICRAVSKYHEEYDCGDVYIYVSTHIEPPMETEQGDIVLPARPYYDVDVKFSREQYYE